MPLQRRNLCCYADCFPTGKRLFGKVKDELMKKIARGRKHKSSGTNADGQPEASSVSVDSQEVKSPVFEGSPLQVEVGIQMNEKGVSTFGVYPTGALPLIEAAIAAFETTFGSRPRLAAHAPGVLDLSADCAPISD